MKPQIDSEPSPARALAYHTTTVAEAVQAKAVDALRASIDRILVMMRDCDDPGRKRRLNETLFVASQALYAALHARSRLVTDH